MAGEYVIIPKKTALILMDFQNFVVERFLSEAAAARVVKNASQLLVVARQVGLFVVHIAVNFRPGYPEINHRNRVFCWLRDQGMVEPESRDIEIIPQLCPRDQEPLVFKQRIGAFTGTDLNMILQAQGIETLICMGVTTSGVVLSTTCQAADLDYQMIMVRDGCADTDDDLHHSLIDKIISRQADILTAEEIKRAILEAKKPAI